MDSSTQDGAFPVTHASLVQLAARPSHPDFREAWERFFRSYWPPLYTWLRRTGSPPEEAQDLLQDFFLEGADGRILAKFDPARARLRTWLKACLRNQRLEAKRREGARKDRERLPGFSTEGAELQIAAPAAPDPEEAFEADWDNQVLSCAIEAVEQRLTADGDEVSLRILRSWVLLVEDRPAADPLASSLGITRENLYMRATRLRHSLAAEIEAQVGLGSADPADAIRERDELLRRLAQ